MTRAGVGFFQMPVWTVLPRQVMSRGRPTLSDTSRAAKLVSTFDRDFTCFAQNLSQSTQRAKDGRRIRRVSN